MVAMAAAALVGVAAMPAMASDEVGGPTAASREPATVTVPVYTTSGMRALTGEAGSIDIQVGRSAPIRVAVDTGFTGLLLFPSAWSSLPKGVRLDKERTKLSGTDISGFMGAAPLTISGVTSVNPVPFVYTTSDSSFFTALRSTGVHGLLGVGLKGSSALTNPLSSLPGDLGLRWSMHYSHNRSPRGSGALVLGAVPPTSPTMVFQMPPNGTDVNGARMWNDHAIPACWTFGRLPEMCLPTTFDSEFTVLRATGVSGRGLQTDADGDFRLGTPVKLAAPDSAFYGWSYRSGQRASVNRSQAFRAGKAAVNTGNAVFFDFTVTYDSVDGRLYLSNPVTKAGSR